MLNIKLSLLAMVGFAALTVASASAMPVSSLSQIAQSDVQDARVVCNSREIGRASCRERVSIDV